MKFKKSVRLYRKQLDRVSAVVQPVTIQGMHTTAKVYESLGLELTITSVCDGEHKAGSKHYSGLAFDCRTWRNEKGDQMSIASKAFLRSLLKKALGEDWDVVIEKTHVHIEYDPK